MKIIKLLNTIVVICLLAGCGGSSKPLDPVSQSREIEKDVRDIYKDDQSEITLTLEDALKIAVKNNLDVRVAEAEQLKAADVLNLQKLQWLPDTEASGNYQGRNNQGASSSRSIISGEESLEPSISTEQHRKTARLEASWNILDATLSLVEAGSASDKTLIAGQRRRKVLHNLMQDVYIAFWRAAAAQEMQKKLAPFTDKADRQLSNIKTARAKGIIPHKRGLESSRKILRMRNELHERRQNMSLAVLELKTLTGLRPDRKIIINAEEDLLMPNSIAQVTESMEDLETFALLNRPEVKEAYLNERINIRNIKKTILEIFPGAEFLLAGNKDYNKFLNDQDWINFSVSLSKSLTDFITLPVRHRQAWNEKKLGDLKRKALIAAILTQVHVARTRLKYESEQYGRVREAYETREAAYRKTRDAARTGLGSEEELLTAGMDALLARWEAIDSCAKAQKSYAALLNTIGIDLWKNGEFSFAAEHLRETIGSFNKTLALKLKEDRPERNTKN
jgi:outer membrane protein TolC